MEPQEDTVVLTDVNKLHFKTSKILQNNILDVAWQKSEQLRI